MGWNYNKRAHAHNYFAPFIYHIVFRKREGFPCFGTVEGDARIPFGTPGCAFINENDFGHTISKSIIGLPKKYPIIQIYQHKVMPDHVHILLRVLDWSKYHLDFYMEELDGYIAGRFSKITGEIITRDDIFEEGYCDKPLLLARNLNTQFEYIRLNPHRLAMRIQYPGFFKRKRDLDINGKKYEAYGNLFLFRNPDKMAVKISRKYTQQQIDRLWNDWLVNAQKGSVMVSPFISKKEKSIRKELEERDSRIILITHEAFPEIYKPARHDFDLCSSGRLLIISLGLPPKTPLTREICIQMNNLAREIAESL